MRYAFAIDTAACIGCHSCAVACKVENNLPDGNWWNRILSDGEGSAESPSGTYPNCSLNYIPFACQHCENPACTRVCPVGATYKDPEMGAVMQDPDKCLGCKICMTACPYNGVRTFNEVEPSYSAEFPVGDIDAPSHQKGSVEKCTMCSHRLKKGMEPACISACPARARVFGDLDDPESEINKLIHERNYKQLLTDRGTHPSVYYLV